MDKGFIDKILERQYNEPEDQQDLMEPTLEPRVPTVEDYQKLLGEYQNRLGRVREAEQGARLTSGVGGGLSRIAQGLAQAEGVKLNQQKGQDPYLMEAAAQRMATEKDLSAGLKRLGIGRDLAKADTSQQIRESQADTMEASAEFTKKLTDPESNVSRLKQLQMSRAFPKYAEQLSGLSAKEIDSLGIRMPDPADPVDVMRAQAEMGRLMLDREKFLAEQNNQEDKITKKPITKGQEALDKAFAKDYQEYVAQGGYSDIEKQIDQLEGAVKELESGKELTGSFTGNIPDILQTSINPEAVSVREEVEEVVQRNLRLILGAQFTEKEGERLIARAYNPRLSEEENAKRVKRLMEQMKKAAKAKQRAARYFEENGTLTGFEGELPTFSKIENNLYNEGLYSPKQERAINRFMDANDISKEKAIEVLKESGRL